MIPLATQKQTGNFSPGPDWPRASLNLDVAHNTKYCSFFCLFFGWRWDMSMRAYECGVLIYQVLQLVQRIGVTSSCHSSSINCFVLLTFTIHGMCSVKRWGESLHLDILDTNITDVTQRHIGGRIEKSWLEKFFTCCRDRDT